MMDTVLNLGLNDETVEGLARKSGDERFAYDSYRRFLQMYGQVVLGIEHHHFEELIENHKLETGAMLDTELDRRGLAGRSSPGSRTSSRARPASRSRRTRRSSCGARSARCSARG